MEKQETFDFRALDADVELCDVGASEVVPMVGQVLGYTPFIHHCHAELASPSCGFHRRWNAHAFPVQPSWRGERELTPRYYVLWERKLKNFSKRTGNWKLINLTTQALSRKSFVIASIYALGLRSPSSPSSRRSCLT